MENHILEGITFSKPFGDGQRVLRLALKYDRAVDGDSLDIGAFSVENRTIVNVFAATAPDGEAPAPSGDYVILELDKHDRAALTVVDLKPHPGPPAGGPGPEGAPPERDRVPRKEHVMANGRVRRGPHGLSKKREPIALRAEQTGEIKDAAGGVIEPGSVVVSSREVNELSDLFRTFQYGDVEYNLYIPENYDPSKKYPLVMFIGDAGIAGKEARITLEQGVGALCWVKEEIQRDNPCFVFAPVHNDEEPITDDDYWCTDRLEVLKQICDYLLRSYSIDTKRVYTTGQSMGCMSSFELMYRYPEYFAGALCVSGHWDRNKIVTCAKRGQHIWYVNSERDGGGFPCACEVRELLDKENIRYGWYEWDGRLPLEELSREVDKAAADDNTFRITVYPGDSGLRLGMDDEMPSGHQAGWCLSYRIKSLCQWLLSNRLD